MGAIIIHQIGSGLLLKSRQIGQKKYLFSSAFLFDWRFYDLQTVVLSQFRRSVLSREVQLTLSVSFSLYQTSKSSGSIFHVCVCVFCIIPNSMTSISLINYDSKSSINKGDLGFLLTTLFFLVSIKRSSAKEQAKDATLSSTLKQIFAGWNESLLRAIKEFD